MLTKKLALGLKRFSIFQLTRIHQKTSVFTKCPRDPQKWTIAPALLIPFGYLFGLPKDYFRKVDLAVNFNCQSSP